MVLNVTVHVNNRMTGFLKWNKSKLSSFFEKIALHYPRWRKQKVIPEFGVLPFNNASHPDVGQRKFFGQIFCAAPFQNRTVKSLAGKWCNRAIGRNGPCLNVTDRKSTRLNSSHV